jgi:predicted DNA binding CopG/RHH family protein
MKSSKKITLKKKKVLEDPLDRDLTYIFDKPGWKKIKFELQPKDKSITLRLSEDMLKAIKARAQDEGLDYQKWIRSSLEDALNKSA